MAIHRVGPQEGPSRKSLGRILVTIDDLQTLMDLLANRDYPVDAVSRDVRVEFDGGYFTEASDLQHLNDEEIKRLQVKTEKTEVVLGRRDSLAIAGPKSLEIVYTQWARTRTKVGLHAGYVVLMTLLILTLISGVVSTIWPGSLSFDPPNSAARSSQVVRIGELIVLLLIVGFTMRFMLKNERTQYAKIVPMSMDDYRRTQQGNFWQRWSAIIAAVSVVVAIAAIIVSVVIAK